MEPGGYSTSHAPSSVKPGRPAAALALTDIEPDSFRWAAEISHDGGATWAFDEEMLATRA